MGLLAQPLPARARWALQAEAAPGLRVLCMRDEAGHVHEDFEQAQGPGLVFCRVDLASVRQRCYSPASQACPKP